jgi:hypothetical protein
MSHKKGLLKMSVSRLFAALMLVQVFGSAQAQTRPGDDYIDSCSVKTTTLYWYGQPGTCLAPSTFPSGLVPIWYFGPQTLEPSVIVQSGGLTCRAQLTFIRTEVKQENICVKVPKQPFVPLQVIGQGCVNQQATGMVYWSGDASNSYTLERAIGQENAFFAAPGPEYSIPGNVSVIYRLRAQTPSGAVGSWSYVNFYANCQGRVDD